MQIFTNATFVSCNPRDEIFNVLIEDKGLIKYIGDTIPEEYAHVLSKTDLEGKCVLPAFCDTHLHFSAFSTVLGNLDLRAATNFAELTTLIKTYLKAQKKKMVLGFGLSSHTLQEKRLPTRAELDKITDIPLILSKYDGHSAVVNSPFIASAKKMRLAQGFDKETGYISQQAFYDAVSHFSHALGPIQIVKNMMAGSHYLSQKGILMAHVVEGVGYPMDFDVDMARWFAKKCPLQMHVFFQTTDVRKVLKRKMTRMGGCFATALDGCFGTQDAALRAPYTNNNQNCGVLYYSQEKVNEFVKKANRNHIQVSLHAIGDAATEQAIIAFENALRDYPRTDHRHVIIHAEFLPPELLERIARLNVHVATQSQFLDWPLEPEHYVKTLVGERIQYFTPVKSMLSSGINVGDGSDAPCTLPDPLFSIHCLCNHPNPSERISVLEAIKINTLGGAKIGFDEKSMGSLEPGKLANFVTIDKNILKINHAELKNTRVENTYSQGKILGENQLSLSRLLLKTLF